MNLFIDTTNNKLLLILENNDNVIDYLVLDNQNRISDILIETIDSFLVKNKIDISLIESFYITIGPGSYTGVRLGVTFTKTIKTFNNNINVYMISSLAFQAGFGKSLSIIDAKGNKYYVGVYDKAKNIIVDQLLTSEVLEEFKKSFKDYDIIKDYENIDYVKNYINLKPFFKLANSIDEVNPLYIKHYI
ncbi:tRNA (adenosine(37)-N6)-threonylcarbamoyltransferase complex dimerization subunit type 1 TsaB [Spiroplasma turonicum]|uniref:Glycoprotease n=1 Tax=Spiroplasma turonicum TaxID=216946 RepID=A0A0K1P8H1_9MOLU|nr:tRNA (adenosine(37)-N6)-threonylcarbamoyltransferase complex dimerization subunit type 1 TsaB [Spiroplasma turonicum]AKU80202.1 glycoprotease [Spiroplasma turonicum]ALX71202.1 glycoprotease [Spiroplasma turonicum]